MQSKASRLNKVLEEEVRDGQIVCFKCLKRVGFTDQPVAYSSMLVNGWLCPKDNDNEEKSMKLRFKKTDD